MEEDYFKIESEMFTDGDINPESYLWKFVNIEKFLSLIVNEEFHLTRLDLFDDKQEAISLEYLKILAFQREQQDIHPLSEYHQIIVNGNQQNQLKEVQKKLQKTNYANCWHLSEDNIENVAMWNLYSGYNSVALKIKYKDFKSNILKYGIKNSSKDFKKLQFSKVYYHNFQDKKIYANIVDCDAVFMKDKSFEYEKEFRIIAENDYIDFSSFQKNKKDWVPIEHYEKIYKNMEQTYIKLELNNFKEYPFNIIFHPKCAPWIKKDLLSILSKFNIRFKNSSSILELR